MKKFIEKIFLRNPKRDIPKGNNLISPANGKIIRIIDTEKKSFKFIKKGILGKIKLLSEDIDKKCFVICIMMNIHNIHIQRSPVSGKIIYQKYSKGNFMNVVFGSDNLEWIENEKNEIIIYDKEKNLKIKVIQVAGCVAKKIKSYVKLNQDVKKGQDLGHITLGSEVILVVPKEKINLRIKEKDIVIDGKTIIGDLI
jgi:phosphatidylserine decarboxylase